MCLHPTVRTSPLIHSHTPYALPVDRRGRHMQMETKKTHVQAWSILSTVNGIQATPESHMGSNIQSTQWIYVPLSAADSTVAVAHWA